MVEQGTSVSRCIHAGAEEQSLLRRHGTYASMRLCEAHLKVLRLQEEECLLCREARQYIQYCEENAAALAKLVSGVRAGHDLVELFLPQEPTGRYFSGDAFVAESADLQAKVYSGVACLLLRAEAEVGDLLAHARTLLAGMIGGSVAQIGDGQEEVDGDLPDQNDEYSSSSSLDTDLEDFIDNMEL